MYFVHNESAGTGGLYAAVSTYLNGFSRRGRLVLAPKSKTASFFISLFVEYEYLGT